MRGVENLVNMRKSGLKPSAVWVEMLPMQKWTRQYTEQADRWVDIHLSSKDIAAIELADLRCLIGLTAIVCGPADDSTEKVARACFAAGAKVVQAVFHDISNPYNIKTVKGLRISAEGEKNVWQ